MLIGALRRQKLPLQALLIGFALLISACGSGTAGPTITDDELATSSNDAPTTPFALIDATPEAAAVPAPAPTTAPTPTAVPAPTTTPTPTGPPDPDTYELLTVEVLAEYPHDTNAFTQGLELHDGVLFESTGLELESDLRRVDIATGEVLQIVPTPDGLFAEGLTKVGDEFVQITYESGRAFYWDAETFELNREAAYRGEGWGLCYDGTNLIMSDGGIDLITRDPETFEEISRVEVQWLGRPMDRINELECVGDSVWANVWKTDLIFRIHAETGIVTGVVDASVLPRPEEASVFNGIAWDSATDTFYVTGKDWPTLYHVAFIGEGAS